MQSETPVVATADEITSIAPALQSVLADIRCGFLFVFRSFSLFWPLYGGTGELIDEW